MSLMNCENHCKVFAALFAFISRSTDPYCPEDGAHCSLLWLELTRLKRKRMQVLVAQDHVLNETFYSQSAAVMIKALNM